MTLNPLILAAGDDDPIKVIFGVIVVIVWIIGGIASAMKKKGQGSEDDDEILVPPPIPREISRANPQIQPPPLPRQAAVPRPRPSSAIPTHTSPVLRRNIPIRKKSAAKRPAPKKAPPPVITAPAGDIITTSLPPAAPMQKQTCAKTIAQSLAPRNLRRQFILTEIFQPPITLRDE